LHDATIADLSSGHSLIETLRANGCSRLFLIEWKSATAKTKLRTIDSYLCDLNVAVDDIGPPVDLIGLCPRVAGSRRSTLRVSLERCGVSCLPVHQST
jgi:poly(3-hydroxyalkanoate) synthetase